jgi:hypothetical protein
MLRASSVFILCHIRLVGSLRSFHPVVRPLGLDRVTHVIPAEPPCACMSPCCVPGYVFVTLVSGFPSQTVCRHPLLTFCCAGSVLQGHAHLQLFCNDWTYVRYLRAR